MCTGLSNILRCSFLFFSVAVSYTWRDLIYYALCSRFVSMRQRHPAPSCGGRSPHIRMLSRHSGAALLRLSLSRTLLVVCYFLFCIVCFAASSKKRQLNSPTSRINSKRSQFENPSDRPKTTYTSRDMGPAGAHRLVGEPLGCLILKDRCWWFRSMGEQHRPGRTTLKKFRKCGPSWAVGSCLGSAIDQSEKLGEFWSKIYMALNLSFVEGP